MVWNNTMIAWWCYDGGGCYNSSCRYKDEGEGGVWGLVRGGGGGGDMGGDGYNYWMTFVETNLCI